MGIPASVYPDNGLLLFFSTFQQISGQYFKTGHDNCVSYSSLSYEISSYHSSDDSYYSLLGYDTIQSGWWVFKYKTLQCHKPEYHSINYLHSHHVSFNTTWPKAVHKANDKLGTCDNNFFSSR